MFQLNDQFLTDVGLADLPAADRAAFLQHVYETLELRVGTALSEGLSDRQLEEFEAIIDRDPHRVTEWIDEQAPNFPADPIYQRMRQALGEQAAPAVVLCEYAATKWLEVNRPDYRAVVALEVDRISGDVRAEAAQILRRAHGEAVAHRQPTA